MQAFCPVCKISKLWLSSQMLEVRPQTFAEIDSSELDAIDAELWRLVTVLPRHLVIDLAPQVRFFVDYPEKSFVITGKGLYTPDFRAPEDRILLKPSDLLLELLATLRAREVQFNGENIE